MPKESAARSATSGATSGTFAGPDAHLYRPRALVIEDDPDVLRTNVMLLELEHLTVDAAATAEAALQAIRAREYDLVALDLSLPDRDGRDLLDDMLQIRPEIAVVVITGRRGRDDREVCRARGAVGYIEKPYDLDTFGADIRLLVERQRERVIRVGDVVLDRVHRRARRGERPLHLQPIDFTLLALLLRHAGQCVTFERMACEGWDERWDHTLAARSRQPQRRDYRTTKFRQAIRRLRRELEAPGEVPLIHVDRTRGYILRVPTGP